MKLPRNVTGRQLIHALEVLDYSVARQRGSLVHLISQRSGEHHLVVPDHHPLKTGLLNRLLKDVAEHHRMSRDELIEKLRIQPGTALPPLLTCSNSLLLSPGAPPL